MKTISIHALDAAVERRIRAKARQEGKSVNQTLKELLAASVGVTTSPRINRHAEFAEFCGVWSAQDAAQFAAAVAEFEKIDPSDWQ